MSDSYLGKVFYGDSLRLLQGMPGGVVDAVITDGMYGVRSAHAVYDWGADPSKGCPRKHWDYHKPIYEECLRVLKPSGVLAWAVGVKHYEHFPEWFGDHRLWTLIRFGTSTTASGQAWVVQTTERLPVPFPADRDGLIRCQPLGRWRNLHPCSKPVEEMLWMVDALTKPGQIVLDPFCGIGTTLIAAERLGRRWIGCDLSRAYGRVALTRLRKTQRKNNEFERNAL